MSPKKSPKTLPVEHNGHGGPADQVEVDLPLYGKLRGRGLWFIGAFDLLLACGTLCLALGAKANPYEGLVVFGAVAFVSLIFIIILPLLVLLSILGNEMIPTIKKRLRDFLSGS